MSAIRIFIATVLLTSFSASVALAEKQPVLDGIWFTCEFTHSKSPPTDNCEMFDDEGFEARDGKISYLRMQGSDETGCKGQKQGQCFPANLPQITITTEPIGAARLDADRLYVTWYGCTQDYTFEQHDHFVSVKPDGRDCFWSRERHFYVAPYTGQVVQK